MGVSEDSQQLRRLARAVMSGELTRDEYRRQRRVLIDRHAGDVPMTSKPLSAVWEPAARGGAEHTVPNTLTAPTVPYSNAGDDITMMAGGNQTRPRQAVVVDVPQPVRRASGGHGDVWIGVVAVAIVLLVVGGLLAFLW